MIVGGACYHSKQRFKGRRSSPAGGYMRRALIFHTHCGDDCVFGCKIRTLSSSSESEKRCLTRDAIQISACEAMKPLLDDGECVFFMK